MNKIPQTQVDICTTLDEIKELLLEKNRLYGDSAINPVRIFSKADPIAQIETRMDDKLSRIRNMDPEDAEDAYLDLLGYLVLHRVAKMQQRRAVDFVIT
jgi:hypothetical protein